jgi:hypothetical protein
MPLKGIFKINIKNICKYPNTPAKQCLPSTINPDEFVKSLLDGGPRLSAF